MTKFAQKSLASLLLLLFASVWSGGTSMAQTTPTFQVFAFNDLGMHCYDADFSVFAVLPPYNVVRAQVVQKGASPRLLTNAGATLSYVAMADPVGSINDHQPGEDQFLDLCATALWTSPAC